MKATLILSVGDLENLVANFNAAIAAGHYSGDLSDRARCVQIDFPLGVSNGDYTLIHNHEAKFKPCAPLRSEPHRPDVFAGEGYRILNNGEVTKAGDQVQRCGGHGWEILDDYQQGRLLGRAVDYNWAAVRRAL